MTLPPAKPFKKTVLTGLCAFIAGGAAMVAGVTALSSYGNVPEVLSLTTARNSAFPESKDALDHMAAELAHQGTELGDTALENIEPAAGAR